MSGVKVTFAFRSVKLQRGFLWEAVKASSLPSLKTGSEKPTGIYSAPIFLIFWHQNSFPLIPAKAESASPWEQFILARISRKLENTVHQVYFHC